MRYPGIELGSHAWETWMLTTTPIALCVNSENSYMRIQSCFQSFPFKVLQSSPEFSSELWVAAVKPRENVRHTPASASGSVFAPSRIAWRIWTKFKYGKTPISLSLGRAEAGSREACYCLWWRFAWVCIRPLKLIRRGGQFYCLYCDKYFINKETMDEHMTCKIHKKK